jgi:hypothetical protein
VCVFVFCLEGGGRKLKRALKVPTFSMFTIEKIEEVMTNDRLSLTHLKISPIKSARVRISYQYSLNSAQVKNSTATENLTLD